MPEVFTIRQVLDAANVSRRQIDTWVSRGLLRLQDDPPVGEARRFTLLDAIDVAALGEFARLGIAPNRMPGGVWGLPGFFSGADGGTLLIWQGPKKGVPYDPFNPLLQVKIVRTGLDAELRDPDKRATVVIDLAALEQRVRDALAASGGGTEAELRSKPPATEITDADVKAIYARMNAQRERAVAESRADREAVTDRLVEHRKRDAE